MLTACWMLFGKMKESTLFSQFRAHYISAWHSTWLCACTPKEDLTKALAGVLDASPLALNVPDIDSYFGLMHTLFTLEDRYGLTIESRDGEAVFRIDPRKGKDAA